MNKKLKILIVFGTRPEAIKMAPVIDLLSSQNKFETKVCVTGQHREMLDQALKLFDIEPDFDLDIMRFNQSLTDITCEILQGLQRVFKIWKPEWVIVHGDTTTTLAASLAAYYEKIKVAHIEAGLRSGDIYSPWPEELNRKITSTIAAVHFAPTELAKSNLLKEGVSADSVIVTGNTVIDSLLKYIEKLESNEKLMAELNDEFGFIDPTKKLVLVTCHRRENFEFGINNLCKALIELSSRRDVQIVYPVHLNPNIQKVVKELLGGKDNIYLTEPLDYMPFIYLMKRAYLILTDSGGVQEEAPSLKKPVLVIRATTERPEAVEAGTVRVVGIDDRKIVKEVLNLIVNKDSYIKMTTNKNPYGDGRAATRIDEYFLSVQNLE